MTLKAKTDALTNEVRACEQKLQAEADEKGALATKLDQYKAGLKAEQAETAKLKRELDQLKAEQTETSKLKQELNQLKEQVASKNTELFRRNRKISQEAYALNLTHAQTDERVQLARYRAAVLEAAGKYPVGDVGSPRSIYPGTIAKYRSDIVPFDLHRLCQRIPTLFPILGKLVIH